MFIIVFVVVITIIIIITNIIIERESKNCAIEERIVKVKVSPASPFTLSHDDDDDDDDDGDNDEPSNDDCNGDVCNQSPFSDLSFLQKQINVKTFLLSHLLLPFPHSCFN